MVGERLGRRGFTRVVFATSCLMAMPGLAAAQPAAETPQAETPHWPHQIVAEGATCIVYQPQAIAWPNHEKLTARAAVAITQAGASTPVLGTVELTLATHTDAATNMVILSDPQLTSSRFPTLDTDQAARLDQQIRAVLPTIRISAVPLNAVLLSLQQTEQPQVPSVSNDPPVIFHSTAPASLVVFDGEPVMAPVAKTGLSYAVNTNWEVFTDGESWFLLNGSDWLEAPSFKGPFNRVGRLPPAFSALPADASFARARQAVPPKPAKGRIPVIFVSTRPAEIIVTEGPPQFMPVAGTGLQAVRNSNMTLFFQPSSGQFFLLISGRWFSAGSLDGPWRYASDNLPPDFSLIPPDGQFGTVLPSVPGTAQAQLAVLQAQVPRQATVKKDAAKLTVVYAGAPRFEPIPGTSLRYGVNTSYQVIEAAGRYYACHQGVWFESSSPLGPWVLAVSVPQVIYTIPPSSPLYPVTFVKVYAATPAAVTYGFTAGYIGGFVAAGAVVYGTGYYYPPVVMPGPVPVYYPYPYSYAGVTTYNTSTGAWTRGGTIYGPYGTTARGGSTYNPATGAYGQGGAIYGPNGGAGAFSYTNPSTGGYARGSASWSGGYGSAQASAFNPRTGVSSATNQNWNPYSRWGSSTFAGPNQTVNTASGSNARGSAGEFQSSTGAEGAGYRGVNGNRGGAVRTQNGDVYAGRDGNAYQHSASGWSKWDNGGWQPVTPPSTSRTTTSAAAPQATQPAATNRYNQGAQGNQASASRPESGRSFMESSSYQQLEQDRQARLAGSQQRFGQGGFGGEGRFGGGESRFSGGFGGHFRR